MVHLSRDDLDDSPVGKGPFEEEQFGNKLRLCHPGSERGRAQ